EDKGRRVLESRQETMGRWILWQPAIIELHDNRLMPLASRDYTFEYQLPKDVTGLTLITKVRYHIQTERQNQMLIDKYGLTAPDPYFFTVYERTMPLTGNLADHFKQSVPDSRMACAAPDNGCGKSDSQNRSTLSPTAPRTRSFHNFGLSLAFRLP